MPSYEKQISREDRWAIIHYVRVLQRSLNAKDSDIDTSQVKREKWIIVKKLKG